VDVNLLTRDVMRAIDERIVAHRERQGCPKSPERRSSQHRHRSSHPGALQSRRSTRSFARIASAQASIPDSAPTVQFVNGNSRA
jgi:hypothetical protein